MAALTESEARERAEATVRAYCGWHVAPEVTETIVLDGPGSGVLLLPTLRVVSIASVTEAGALLDPATYAWSVAGFVRRDPDTWHVELQERWTSALRGIEVVLTHGYAEWPPELVGLLDGLAARVLAGPSVLRQVGAVAYATGVDGLPVGGSLTIVEQAALDAYRLPRRS